MVVELSGKFAFGQDVPQFDHFVTTARNDLPVVRGERATVHFLGVTDELLLGLALSKVP